MDLVANIKAKRAHTRRKSAFRQTLFDRIGGIVHAYHLDDTFLERIERPIGTDFDRNLGCKPLKLPSKAPLELPLFTLLSAQQYAIAVIIIQKIDSPYLDFANAPDEILLCRTLYRLNARIPAGRLKKCHFGALLVDALVHRQMGVLSRQVHVLQASAEPLTDERRRRLGRLSKALARLDALAVNIAKSNDGKTAKNPSGAPALRTP